MSTLQEVLEQITSSKVKERQEGLSQIRSLFSSERSIRKVSTRLETLEEYQKRDGKGELKWVRTPDVWLRVFQALFDAVGLEKSTVTKLLSKSTGSVAAAEKRLGDTASTVRWLVEKVVHLLDKKRVEFLLQHILHMSNHSGKLFPPISLDYAKTIRCILSFTPHLEQLSESLWVQICQRSFNVTLGDRLTKTLAAVDDPSVLGGTDADDSVLSSDEDDEAETPSISKPTQNRKRPRGEARGTPGPSAYRATPPLRTSHPVSLEQIEFTALLAVLLRSSTAPFLSEKQPHLAFAILDRLLRFVKSYGGETSLHQDYLCALSATLSQVALNRRDAVVRFARGSWQGLVAMWRTKNRRIKEDLVVILRMLFPYYTAPNIKTDGSSMDFDYAGGVSRLWELLNGEAESRWGVDGLSLDSLRLALSSRLEDDHEAISGAFVARTFRYGWNFDPGQALAWAILELQADCAEKLFVMSEFVSPSRQHDRKGKRIKVEVQNPISTLLRSIQHSNSTVGRAYSLQILLFFIDRHWTVLHETLQQEVMTVLLQFVAVDDAIVQTWTFLCFAAVAERQVSSGIQLSPAVSGPSIWDPVWTHAMRRSNVAVVCRAACHVTRLLLLNMKTLLTPQRVLPEIETFAKDLDFQGPPFPYESVCAFMALCLQVANQDMRLYRMHIEDAMLSWLINNWGLSDGMTARGSVSMPGRSRVLHPLVSDMMALLEAICWLPKRSSLICRMLLPESAVVDQIQDEGKTAVIRNFLLYAQLPSFHRPSLSQSKFVSSPSAPAAIGPVRTDDLAKPSPKERKISTNLLKLLDTMSVGSELAPDASTMVGAEKARRMADSAVLALFFESTLVFNGTQANRHVLQTAGRLIANVSRLLVNQRWTPDEKAFVLLGFEPLIAVEQDSEAGGWEGLASPQPGSGIRKEVFRSLTSNVVHQRKQTLASRRELQRIVWQNPDVQGVLSGVMSTFKDILRSTVSIDSPRSQDAMDIDEQEFAPIRTANVNSQEAIGTTNTSASAESIITVCMSFLAIGPILATSSGEPTRDDELMRIIAAGEKELLMAGPAYFANVRQGTLHVGLPALGTMLELIEGCLLEPHNSKSEKWQMLTVRILDAVLVSWVPEKINHEKIRGQLCQLSNWLFKLEKKEINGSANRAKAPSWMVRDAVLAFMARYIALDPYEAVLVAHYAEYNDIPLYPSKLLPQLSADEDIRVRFRAANVNASLFTLPRFAGKEPMRLYESVRTQLCVELTSYEHMLSRFLTLGSILVVSSAVRRGPYWHLLETCHYTDDYSSHIQAIFNGASERLGLSSASELFEIYADQVAYSIWHAGVDFLRFPPSVLGYQSRREWAEAAFRAFAPTNILAGGDDPDAINRGRHLFVNHCTAIHISPEQGFKDCFPDLVGHELTKWIDKNMGAGVEHFPPQLEDDLRAKTIVPDDDVPFPTRLHQHVDGIAIAILRIFGDQDYSADGVIVEGLREKQSNEAAYAFQVLTGYRALEDVDAHQTNLPSFGTVTTLQALKWLEDQAAEVASPATTYQVLHQLLADIQHIPLVNEQMRRMNALCLWISCYYEQFREPVLLHTLLHGVSSLLAQTDLVRAAQSVLHWTFRQYLKTPGEDSRLADVLIRICSIAHDYARSTDAGLAETGTDMLHWLDSQMLLLNGSRQHRHQIAQALPAWPQKPSAELASIHSKVASRHLSKTLADARMTSNKFRIVRLLRDTAVKGEYQEAQFSRIDFWRLKDCIPPLDRLQVEDVDAFITLLLVNNAQIHGFGLNPLSAQVARHRPHDVVKPVSKTSMPERSIMEHLLLMLASDTPSRVHTAYQVLRTICSTSLPGLDSWPDEYVTEMNYIRERPYPALIRDHPNLDVLTTSMLDIAKTFSAWVSTIATLLSDMLAASDPFYAQLAVVLETDTEFAEQVLPILVHKVLSSALERAHPDKPNTIRMALSQYFTAVLASNSSDISCLRTVVNIALHLRHFQPAREDKNPLAYNQWLDLDYLLLSQSAVSCGAYTTALLFHELAAEYSEDASRQGPDAERILYEIYSHIEEPDGFYGIQTSDLHQFLIKKFHHEHQWDKAFQFHGAAIEARSQGAHETDGLLRSLHSFGFDHLAQTVQKNTSDGPGPGFGSKGISYHLGWRTETWDLPAATGDSVSGASLYQALRAIHRERDPRVIDATVDAALFKEMVRLRHLGDEDLVGIREVTQSLLCLNEVKLWRQAGHQQDLQRRALDSKLWSSFSQINGGIDFPVLENIMATRLFLVRSVRQKEQTQHIGEMRTPFVSGLIDIETRCLLRISTAARYSHNLQIALNSIVRAQRLELKETTLISEEFANVLWEDKEQKTAVQFLKNLVGLQSDKQQKAWLLARLGSWSSEAGLEKPIEIWKGYFHPAATLLEDLASSTSEASATAAVYHQCAVFADRQYHAILQSPDTVALKRVAELKADEVKIRDRQVQSMSLSRGAKEYREQEGHLKKAKAQLSEDNERYRHHQESLDTFLHQSIDMYSRCLQASDSFDDDGHIRLVSLWFANFDVPNLEDIARIAIERVPSRKFVFLAHQLSARLAKPASGSLEKNQVTLQALVLKMCREHPFHSLYQVYCLRSSDSSTTERSSDKPAEKRRASSRHNPPSSQGERADAAVDIFARLHSASNGLDTRARDVENVCRAYLQWAKHSIKEIVKGKNGATQFTVPPNLSITTLQDVQVPVVTASTPLDPTMKYSNCAWIRRYETTFTIAGGINLPKISTCLGTDGGRYMQLFKGEGNDDLRQDAVMEQVFDLVNVVLRRDRETRRRNLSIRDYKVVPLAPQAGVIEFVGNTAPLGRWLTSAHKMYGQNGVSHAKFFEEMTNERKKHNESSKMSLSDKLVPLFEKLRKRFKPVMRHFFTEQHKMPMSWFSMRLNYTRSVATTSIVGHILGLGDRHTSNILMDNVTGEAVHIDLGIAFEQGKLLPIPECVPFRMTADMVDGMGTAGTQGVFQRCAEETLRVLRDGSEIILTVLEVFKYDPLHSWTASEMKIKRAQDVSESEGSKRDSFRHGTGTSSSGVDAAADRALTAVTRKLDKTLSVEYTVNELISEATDPANLACMYIGWSPHH